MASMYISDVHKLQRPELQSWGRTLHNRAAMYMILRLHYISALVCTEHQSTNAQLKS